jgi:hypothetical protein
MTDDNQQALSGFVPEPNYDAHDYVRLPESGLLSYNLRDAALLAALDIWSVGGNPEFPVGDFDYRDHDDPAIREGIRPMMERLVSTLVRSVEDGHLEATVFARDLKTGRLIPERTYVERNSLVGLIETLGFPRGELILSMEQDESDAYWDAACSIAYERAVFRHGVRAQDPSMPIGTEGADAIDKAFTENLIKQQAVHIAELNRQLRGSGAAPDRPLSARERNTLHVTIGALLEQIPGKQEAIIAEVTTKHPRKPGLSRRTLENVFARARRALEE